MGAFVEEKGLGAVYTPDTVFVLEGEPDNIITMRRPDGAFVRADRVQHIFEGYYYLAPDLAVEIISASERPGKTARKLNDYQRSGVREVWQVYPEAGEVLVYRRNKVRVYGVEDTLSGSEVLPDFELPLKSLFA